MPTNTATTTHATDAAKATKAAPAKNRAAAKKAPAGTVQADAAEKVPSPLAGTGLKLGGACVLAEVDHATGRTLRRRGTLVDVRQEGNGVGAYDPDGRHLAVVEWADGQLADGVPLDDLAAG